MICTSCNHDNRPGAKFCEECAAPLKRACAACSADLRPSAKFCDECGTKADGAARPVPPPPRETPKHLADKIRQSKAAVEGERKQVTVLFADVKGSMELAESLDAEEFSRIMSRFFAILTEGVERFEGFVDKFTGDGIMALFGAPIAHEDHAQRACYAALHLRDEIARYATELKRAHGLSFSTRMGLNSGEVVVGTIGDDLRMDYTAQGHTVGLAQRMESLASPDTCFMSATTANLVGGYFALDDLGEFRVKGVATPMHVHRLNGIGSSKTRLDVSRSRGLSRFVGRGDEMHVLEAALAKADAGAGQVIGIVGEAGLGKSRVCYEFLERCRERGLMTYQTTGVAHGKSIPFLPMLKLFRAFFGITDQDSAATARERIAGRMLLLDEKLRERLPLTFEFLGVPDPENPPPQMDPDARQRQMLDVVRRVVQARGQKETSVTLIEDLHWFDGGSAALLEPMVAAAAGTRGLVLLNFRPEYQAPWMGKSFYHQLPLTPLGPEAIRELLAALLGNDASMRGLGAAIHARTAGNPFFTEEVVQNLIETGKLQGGKGAYRLTTTVEKLEVPSSVHALLAARIDRLAEREKGVLQTAAVIGREFDEPTLAAVTGMEAPPLREALTTLKDTEFVYEQSLYPVTEYLFKHPLTQEVALNSQLQARRQRLHARVAGVLEQTHAKDLDGHAALLALHWEEAGESVQAVRWHRRAAEWAGTRDPIQGLRHWQKVRALGRTLNDNVSREARLLACGFILSSGTWRLGMSEEDVRGCLDEARSLAQESGRTSAIAMSLSGVSLHLGTSGRVAAGLKLAEEAMGMLSDGTEHEEALGVDCKQAYLYFTTGRLSQALDAFDRLVALTGGSPELGRTLMGYSVLMWGEMLAGWVLAVMGRFDESWPRLDRSIRLSRENKKRENLGWAIDVLGFVSYIAGGTSRTPVADLTRTCLESVDIAETGNILYSQLSASRGLALAQFLTQDYAASEERFTEALAQSLSAGTGCEWNSFILAVFADSCLARGDVEAAISRAREGITFADMGGAWFQSALARAALIDALIANGAPETEIAPIIAEAHELVRKTGGNSLLPRLREAEARLAGRHDRAAMIAGLREAQMMWRQMGAPDPADRIEQELTS